MLIDHAVIYVRSGSGGDGCVSFHRAKYMPKGGPDGGDGGRGGSVFAVADTDVATLLDFTGRHHWRAQDGHPGKGKQMTGADGRDLDLRLPPGTLIYDDDTGELIADLDEPGARLLIAPGGKGGYGNERFKTATHQTPRESTPGEPAVELNVRLELKLIADVGLLGKPNAGKSTFLSRVSRATPKVADYPFTTLEPQLGIAELPGHRRIVVADIPGLIEGAAEGHGLGIAFLKHIERTRLLLHLLELDPTDGSDPISNYHAIRKELAHHSETLAAKPEIVLLTKVDMLPDAEDREVAVELIREGIGHTPMLISSVSREGLAEVLEACWTKLDMTEDEGWQPTRVTREAARAVEADEADSASDGDA